MAPSRSIVIVNQHTNNYGDDAAGRALVQGLDSLDIDRIDVFYIWHGNSRKLPLHSAKQSNHALTVTSGVRDTRVALAREVLRRLIRLTPSDEINELLQAARTARAVLVSPAGSNLGIYKDWMYLFVLLILVLDGVRPVFVQNTIGRSNSRVFDSLTRFVLRRSIPYVREQESHDYLARSGIPSVLGVDTAFLLADTPPDPLSEEAYVAVVPTQLSNWHRDFRSDQRERYIDEIVAGVARYSTREAVAVKIVPHLYGHQAETEFLRTLEEQLIDLDCNAQIAPVESLDDYRRVIARSQAVVSMRYHGLVLAGLERVPCVSVAYENKMVEAARYLGLLPLSLAVSQVSSEQIAQRLEDAIRNREPWTKTLERRIPKLRRIASAPLLPLLATELRQWHEEG